MINTESIFVFVRHAESKKNIRDITGGIGEPLTELGLQQAEAFAYKLLSRIDKKKQVILYSSDIIQAKQTADKIAAAFSVEVRISTGLAPAGLGIAGGLSGKKIEKQYPDISKRLNAWRNQEIEAVDLNIPDMETPEQFWVRIMNFLSENANCSINIVVCTRSVMVLVANLVAGNKPQKGGGYKHISIKHCAPIAFEYKSCNQNKQAASNSFVSQLDYLTMPELGGYWNE